MKTRLLSIAVCLVLSASLVNATDLTKIERTITKEPVYQAKPKYCLLVFGPEAKTRVWLVVDGEALYIDRNGNGDLTEPGERIPKLNDRWVATIPAAGEGAAAPKLTIYVRGDGLALVLEGKVLESTYGLVAAGQQTGKAPIVHFLGPLSFSLGNASKLDRSGGGLVCAQVQTAGLAALTRIAVVTIPQGVSPVAELEFPTKDGAGPPVKLKVVLSTRQC